MANWNYIDITGQKFNRLTAIKYVGKSKWLFQCDCGKQVIIAAANVKRGNTMSCGCLHNELAAKKMISLHTKHGKINTPEYRAWNKLKGRCLRKSDPKYKDYGGRGIKVCDRWLNSFENFLTDMGEKPSPKHSIDRIDVNGNYEPSNCRWADIKTQSNNKRKSLLITHNGRTQTLTQWCEELNVSHSKAHHRYHRGIRNFEDLFNPNNTWFKKVAQYDDDGNLICVYASQTDAGRALGMTCECVRKYCAHEIKHPRYNYHLEFVDSYDTTEQGELICGVYKC